MWYHGSEVTDSIQPGKKRFPGFIFLLKKMFDNKDIIIFSRSSEKKRAKFWDFLFSFFLNHIEDEEMIETDMNEIEKKYNVCHKTIKKYLSDRIEKKERKNILKFDKIDKLRFFLERYQKLSKKRKKIIKILLSNICLKL